MGRSAQGPCRRRPRAVGHGRGDHRLRRRAPGWLQEAEERRLRDRAAEDDLRKARQEGGPRSLLGRSGADGAMNVKILGAAMTRFGRQPDADLRSLAEAASAATLADADLSPDDVQLVVFGNATDGVLHGQEMIRGEVALRHAGFAGIPIINVENACASSSSAFHVAWLAVAAGEVDVALVLGVEQL